MPNFIPIRFQMTEPYRLFEQRRPKKNNNKMSSDVGSVPDPKKLARCTFAFGSTATVFVMFYCFYTRYGK